MEIYIMDEPMSKNEILRDEKVHRDEKDQQGGSKILDEIIRRVEFERETIANWNQNWNQHTNKS